MHNSIQPHSAARSTINRWSVVGFVVAAAYVALAAVNGSISDDFHVGMAVLLVGMAVCSAIGSMAALGGNYRTTRGFWMLAGILGIPSGLVLRVEARRVREARANLSSVPQFQ